MALKYCEVVLAIHTRVKGEDGNWKGGASRYLSLIWKPWGIIWAACFIGGTIGVDAALFWADFVNMVNILLNVVGMLFLTKTIHELTVDYFERKKQVKAG